MESTMKIRPQSTPKSQKAFYGIGHILNDLCANCWFSYALIFWTKIVGLSETDAGLLLLIGQVADAISTLFIGYACDRTKFRWYGKRKLWHAIGSIFVLLSFPFVFNLCLTCEDSSDLSKMLYYSAFVVLFQFGWAATQISHLALIPEIAKRASDVVHLNSIRSGFFFVSGIFVYGLTWVLLGRAEGDEVDSSLVPQFRLLSIIVISVGFVFVLIFHFGTKEAKPNDEDANNGNNNDVESDTTSEASVVACPEKSKTWRDWLKDGRFYKTGLLYMCTRLAINISQSFLVLYLTDALHFKKEAIAYFPLIVLICGVITSTFMQKLTKKIGFQLTYIIGAALMVAGSVWLFAVEKDSRNSVYGAVSLTGISISIILVTSLAKTAELIGKDKESGAFVYSCMSFLDKLATGLVIFAIQALKPTAENRLLCSECEWFSRITQSVVPGGFAMVGLLTMIFLFPSEFMCIRKPTSNLKATISKSNLIEDDDSKVNNKNNGSEFFYETQPSPSVGHVNENFNADHPVQLNTIQQTDINSPAIAIVDDDVSFKTFNGDDDEKF